MCIWNDQISAPTFLLLGLTISYLLPAQKLHLRCKYSLFGMKFESAMSLLKFNFP